MRLRLQIRAPGEVSLIAAGLAGVDYDGSGEPEMRELFVDLGYKNSLIEGDMVMAHSGALAGDPGVLALAGTGSSVLGIGQGGERVKVGGWGPVFGDEGSGISYRAVRPAGGRLRFRWTWPQDRPHRSNN